MKRVTLFAGHYGSGKTNIAVNYALGLSKEGHKTLIADLDIVNPYFRTRDSEEALKEAGVEIVVSSYANTNVDVPALPEEMYRIIDDKETHAVVDVGGDDRGALALGIILMRGKSFGKKLLTALLVFLGAFGIAALIGQFIVFTITVGTV